MSRVKAGVLSTLCAVGVFAVMFVGTAAYTLLQADPACDGPCFSKLDAIVGPTFVIAVLCGLAAGGLTWYLMRERRFERQLEGRRMGDG